MSLGRCGSNLEFVNFEHNMRIDILSIGSGNGLVAPGNKLLPEPVLTKICDAMPYNVTSGLFY